MVTVERTIRGELPIVHRNDRVVDHQSFDPQQMVDYVAERFVHHPQADYFVERQVKQNLAQNLVWDFWWSFGTLHF